MPKHSERRRLPYRPEQMFALVADIERYPEFLPWCVGARIRRREGDTVHAEGPFRYLRNHWAFTPTEEGCEVDFYVDFEFRNLVLQKVIGVVFTEAVKRMVAAFESRARQLYAGTATVPPRPQAI
jgi:coenzyme Q-binding protein COQ10